MNNIKIVITGAVGSTLTTLNSLIKHNLNIVGILGYEPKSTNSVSGLTSFKEIAKNNSIEYVGFEKINQENIVHKIKEWSPDVLFVVGLSQLIKKEILNIPRLGTVGFHPTDLPQGRGRAPLAWLVNNKLAGAANFFLMGEGTDDGPIFVKEPFDIDDDDDSTSVGLKIRNAIEKALDKWLPQLKQGIWYPVPQDEENASYFGIRKPEDGLISWNNSAYIIDRQIKAATHPHPGAFSFIHDQKIIIWKSRIENTIKIQGITGRILIKNEFDNLLIQTGNGLLWLTDYEIIGENNKVQVGNKLGYYDELEIWELKKQLKQISELLKNKFE